MKPVFTFLCACLLFVLQSGCSGDASQQMALEDGTPNFESLLGRPIEDVTASGSSLSPQQQTELGSLITSNPVQYDSLELYTAMMEADDEMVPVNIVSTSLAPQFPGGRLALVFGSDGGVLSAVLWGHPEFDNEEESAWENYYRQFAYMRSSTDIESALDDSERFEIATRIQASTESSDRGIVAWQRHAQTMIENNWLIRRTFAMTGAGQVPPVEWFETIQSGFEEMVNEYTGRVRAVAGDAAATEYEQIALESAEMLNPIIAHARDQNADNLRGAMSKFRRASCGGCHSIESDTLGPDDSLKDGLQKMMIRSGARRDLYVAGFDLWTVPGKEAESQAIANQARALTVIAAEAF